MKRQERHKLKENEFARTVGRAREVIETQQRAISMALVVAIVALAAVGGYMWWRQSRAAGANAMFATALAVHQAPVTSPPTAAPGSPVPLQQPGTYGTEKEKLEAALPKFIEAAERYPSTPAGVAARYHAASILASLGRFGEAEQRYQEVVNQARGNLYARTARLGLAEVQAAQKKYDSAITLYTELSRDQNSQLPVDGVLMQLGRACARAGRKEEAVRAFTRVVEEFPQSAYVQDARRELEDVRKS
jgi:TolA-binding protein